jgi:hypothetical protein
MTATGTDPRNVAGRTSALTVLTTFKWWGPALFRVVFVVGRIVPASLGALVQLRFIHFARWAIVPQLGSEDPKPRRLRDTLLYFETNFNGGWEEYIDAFCYVLARGPTRSRRVWATHGFPDALPTGPFKDFIRRHQVAAAHFYSAYPAATTPTVLAALELDPQLDAFVRSAGDLADDDAFAAAWRDFLTRVQRCV